MSIKNGSSGGRRDMITITHGFKCFSGLFQIAQDIIYGQRGDLHIFVGKRIMFIKSLITNRTFITSSSIMDEARRMSSKRMNDLFCGVILNGNSKRGTYQQSKRMKKSNICNRS